MKLFSLEDTFTEACNQHDHLKLLESQWRFDKELISKALQNIASIFPHYSRHDSSHSKQIVVNIERMLGDRLINLTATDMWLILEAAYSHDIGMVITHNQIKDMDTQEFGAFIDKIIDQPTHELSEFAKSWKEKKAVLPIGSEAHTFFDEYRQLLAEWYRRKHPENAAKIIRSPFEEIGLTSPRNELLPKRLFGVLAAVCNAHGQPFEELMRLPFSEAGMATEDCHPRYVAALLRMADLLDVDDNRFCPVMMKMSGAALPTHSHAHFEKHQSIKHFRLDQERIKIEVSCPTLDSYEVAFDWFEWLEKEYHNQSQHWPKIVPNKKLGRLPTLATPKVNLDQPYLILNKGLKPRFELNKDSSLEILRSTGFYSTKMSCIREVLQNAVDASLIAMWIDKKEAIKDTEPFSEELISMLNKYSILFDLKESDEHDELIISDQGVGISEDDLRNMLSIGRSNKKSDLIKGMPSWIKPAGNFGIGLQSIFLISDEFTIETKSRITHEAFHITFKSGKNESIAIKKIPTNNAEYGTTISIKLEIKRFPERISISFTKSGNELLKSMNKYDFTKKHSDLKIYEKTNILEAIEEFNTASSIKVKNKNHPALTSENKETNTYFSKELNIALRRIEFYAERNSITTLFRGQQFTGCSAFLEFTSAIIDFYGEEASNLISYNREKILQEAIIPAVISMQKTILEYIEKKYHDISIEQKPYAAAFYFINTPNEADKHRYKDDLLKLEVPIKKASSETKIPLKKIIGDIQNGKIKEISNYIENDASTDDPKHIKITSKENTIKKLIKLISTEDGKTFFQIQIKEYNLNKSKTNSQKKEVIFFSKNEIIPTCKEKLKLELENPSSGIGIGNRMLFPTWGKFKDLSIQTEIKWPRIYWHESYNAQYMLLPYTFSYNEKKYQRTKDISDETINWVKDNLKEKNKSKEEIVALYKELLTEFEYMLK